MMMDRDTREVFRVKMNEREVYSVKITMERNPAERLPSGDPGPITEEELAFGRNVGFPMDHRPAEY